MHQLVEVWQVALTLHPEYGTQPNVYYVPPLPSQAFDAEGRPTGEPRVPEDYLRQLFGPGVDAALATLQVEIAKKEAGGESALMDLLIAYRHGDMFRRSRPRAGRS